MSKSVAALPKGSTKAPNVSLEMSLMKLPAMEYPTKSAIAAMNEAIVERISTATEKMMAAEKRMFGTAMNRKACTCGNNRFGPTRKGSTEGHQLPNTIPSETPSTGNAAMNVLPRNLPTR